MLIGNNFTTDNTQKSQNAPSAAEAEKIDNAFAALFEEETPRGIIREITKDGMNGMMAWKIKEMRKEIAAKVMAEMNVTREDIAGMSSADRVAMEQKIMDAVEEQLKLAIREQMEKELHGMAPKLLDKQTTEGIYSALQNLDNASKAISGDELLPL